MFRYRLEICWRLRRNLGATLLKLKHCISLDGSFGFISLYCSISFEHPFLDYLFKSDEWLGKRIIMNTCTTVMNDCSSEHWKLGAVFRLGMVMVAWSLHFVRLKPSMSFDAIDKLSNWTDTSLDLQLSFSSTCWIRKSLPKCKSVIAVLPAQVVCQSTAFHWAFRNSGCHLHF